MKRLLTLLATSIALLAQSSQPTPLRVVNFSGITSDFIIDNRSATTRQITYSSIACSGSGSWQVDLEYSSSSSGPWTNYGSGASVTQASSPPIAFGFLLSYPNYIRVNVVSGSPTCSYAGTVNFYLSSTVAAVTYPIAVNQGGTGAITAANARTNLGITLPVPISDGGTGAITATAARSALGLNLTGIYSGDGTTPAAVAASSQLQYLRSKANQTSTSYEFATSTEADAAAYNWSYTNGGQASADLSATGTKTITLTPCPQGVYNTTTSITSGGRLTGIVDSANTATVTTTTKHRLSVGAYIRISGVSTDADLNGLYTIVSTPTDYTFTITTSNVVDGTYNTSTDPSISVGIPTHAVRISGGVGTAETKMIIGGTCTPGTASGTIQVITTQTHTGSWTVGSATAGIQEAVSYSGSLTDGGAVRLANGNVTIYESITLPGTPAVTIRGSGPWASLILMDTSNTSSDLIRCITGTCLTSLEGFIVAGHAGSVGGAGIHIKDSTSGRPYIRNVLAADTYGGFFVDNADYVNIVQSFYSQNSNTNATYGIWIDGISSEIIIAGGQYTAPEINVSTMLDYGIRITGADGVLVSGTAFRGNEGVSIFSATGTSIGTVLFDDVIIDRCRTVAIAATVDSGATPTFFGNVFFTDSHIAGSSAMEDQRLIALDTSALGTGRAGIVFDSNLIVNGNQECFRINGVNDLQITNNQIINCDVNNSGSFPGAAISVNAGSVIKIANNTIRDTNGSPVMDYGVYLTGTMSYLNMTGNIVRNVATNPYNNGATLTNAVATGNTGADDLQGSITAATTVTLAPYFTRRFGISGTTTIQTINGFIGGGDTRVFYAPSGLTLGTAGNIATGLTTSGVARITCDYNVGDSKWYCSQ